ncbi:MAG: universal stress protein [Verrucomicrobiota bacterium]
MNENKTASSGKGARLSLHVKPSPPQIGAGPSDLALNPSCLQLKRILVPVDFSECSDKALRYAQKFAEQFGSQIVLLHVIQPMVYPSEFGYPPPVVDTIDETMREKVVSRLSTLASGISAATEALVRMGQPYHEITTAAEELDVDLIIIPTHGRTGLKHVVLGSTAERVVRHAPCPVLTVREREHDFI